MINNLKDVKIGKKSLKNVWNITCKQVMILPPNNACLSAFINQVFKSIGSVFIWYVVKQNFVENLN